MKAGSNSINLRLFNKSDIDLKVKWINDEEVNTYLHYDLPLCPDRTLNWFNKIMSNDSREDYVYEVSTETGYYPVGLIGLLNIDRKNKKAEFYIVNGEKEFWGKGLAFEATELFLKHSFLKYNLNKIYLYTEVDNLPAQKLFEKVGFTQEGLMYEDLIYMGRKVNRYYYGIYRKDFLNE
ncbi:GNAT family N-acetyltransferase [Thalassobacillus sp. CUG 92003]|uniref:GNAT family N-acetyltransferase n=1 Tax=Thalassobacillus sp. CUG 92003 TaxID=2736641 RepID=UPI0015E6AD7E